MTTFIEGNKDRFGVEPICRVLTEHGVKIAPSTYYAAKTRPASTRARRDEQLLVEIKRVFSDRRLGRGLAGARKVWRLLARDPAVAGRVGPVARCTVNRPGSMLQPVARSISRATASAAITTVRWASIDSRLWW